MLLSPLPVVRVAGNRLATDRRADEQIDSAVA